jgi:hypothetical protein
LRAYGQGRPKDVEDTNNFQKLDITLETVHYNIRAKTQNLKLQILKYPSFLKYPFTVRYG